MKSLVFSLAVLLVPVLSIAYTYPGTQTTMGTPQQSDTCYASANSYYELYVGKKKFFFRSFEATDVVLQPGEGQPFYQEEVFLARNATENAKVYYGVSAFMGAQFGHAVLVGAESCDLVRIQEVFFE